MPRKRGGNRACGRVLLRPLSHTGNESELSQEVSLRTTKLFISRTQYDKIYAICMCMYVRTVATLNSCTKCLGIILTENNQIVHFKNTI